LLDVGLSKKILKTSLVNKNNRYLIKKKIEYILMKKTKFYLITMAILQFSCTHVVSQDRKQLTSPSTNVEQENHIAPTVVSANASTTTTTQPAHESTTTVQHHQAQPTTSTEKHHHVTPEGTAPEVGLRYLRNGNIRFVKGFFRNDGASPKDVKRLSSGQNPHTVIVSCSDSRVPPEVIFDQKLGEIFVVRTAGETLDPTSIGSIEYAVEHLGTKNIVVLGHTKCGAVKAAFGTLDGADAGSDNLNKLVQDIHPRISKFKGQEPSLDYSTEAFANASGVAQDLKKRSKIIADKVNYTGVKITPAIYDIDTGKVTFQSH